MKKRRCLKPELDSAAIALGNGWITVYLRRNLFPFVGKIIKTGSGLALGVEPII